MRPDKPWGQGRLVLATHNQGKVQQFRSCLPPAWQEDVVSLAEVAPALPPVEETGDTFAANALRKAQAASAVLEEAVLADDSGLVVPVLGGHPGVNSARYAGEKATAAENCARLQVVLAEVPAGELRTAYFVCALAFCEQKSRGTAVKVAYGLCQGHVVLQPRREQGGGFGYDPLFYYPPLGQTMAELSAEQRWQVNHRGQAWRALWGQAAEGRSE